MPDVWVPHTVLVASRWFRIACNFIRNVVGVAFQVALDIITILFWWYVKSVYRPPGVFSETCNHTAGFGFLCCHQNKWLLGARNTSLRLVHLIVQEKVHACWINAPVPLPLLILPDYCILIFWAFGKAKEFWVQTKRSLVNVHLKKSSKLHQSLLDGVVSSPSSLQHLYYHSQWRRLEQERCSTTSTFVFLPDNWASGGVTWDFPVLWRRSYVLPTGGYAAFIKMYCLLMLLSSG